MSEGEFAVLFANRQPAGLDPAIGPVAVICPSLVDAVTYAEAYCCINSERADQYARCRR